MERNYFSVLFYVRRTKLLKSGEAPICLRVTVNGRRAEVQIKRSVKLENWSVNKECALGKDRSTMELNSYLNVVRSKILQIHRELKDADEPISAAIIVSHFNNGGMSGSAKMLLEVFREQNVKIRELLDVDYVKGTVLRYERTDRYLGEFIKQKYRLNDIPLKRIDHEFVTSFAHFVKVEKRCSQNTTINYMKCFKKVVRFAISNKWLSHDPFLEVKFRLTKTNRDFLTEAELNTIIEKKFTIERVAQVRDVFVFCALTGLAFTDVQHLRWEHISQDVNGDWWIRKPREKTSNMCSVPLMDIPRDILMKYKYYSECRGGMLLPIPSNQKYNAYLREIADLCGITKAISSHTARHTFACVAIANKVSLESIAKMLGHSDLRTTRIYAKMMDATVAEEMQGLKRKFAVNE